jgi:predicted negative regulator of RcsB-dependent stress response
MSDPRLMQQMKPGRISKIAHRWSVCYFLHLHKLSNKEGTVGTTKLTRKEILAEDPVHEGIIWIVEFFRANSRKIGIAVVVVVLAAIGIYAGAQYLENRESQAQELLGKGIDLFHGQIAADATNDPYSKGPAPTFKSETAKYQAAAKEFSLIVERYSFGRVPIVARYYLGLSQLQIGQKKEAVQNLELVGSNSKDRTVGFLAKKVLATEYANSGNNKGAAEILYGMIKDPQCQLPKEDLSIQLSKVLIAQGKRDEAIKVLKDANSQQGPAFSMLKQQVAMELDKLQKLPAANPGQPAVRP